MCTRDATMFIGDWGDGTIRLVDWPTNRLFVLHADGTASERTALNFLDGSEVFEPVDLVQALRSLVLDAKVSTT